MLSSTFFLAVTCLLIDSAGSQKLRTVACEGSEARLQCDEGQVISVGRAAYGRRDQKTCSAGRPVQQLLNVQCSRNDHPIIHLRKPFRPHKLFGPLVRLFGGRRNKGRVQFGQANPPSQDSTSEKVGESCNGKQSCSIRAENSVFGDPCVGTYKYLEVDYTCQQPDGGSQNGPTVACEGSEARLQCDQGQLIFVSRAIYGRSDQKTCSAGRPVQQLQNVRCSRSSDKVAQSCNGKQSCSIRAENSVFGDPCVGTYKYLEVDYVCYDAVTG